MASAHESSESESIGCSARRQVTLRRVLTIGVVFVGIAGLAVLFQPFVSQYLLIQRLECRGAIVWHDLATPASIRQLLGNRLVRAIDPIMYVGRSPSSQDDAAITAQILDDIEGIDSIRVLSLDLTDEQIHRLDCPSLGVLSLYSSVTDEGLSELQRFPNLIAVTLTDSQVTDAGIGHLVEIPDLQTLNLHRCDALTDSALEPLAGSTSVRFVEIYDCAQLGDGALRTIGSFSRLRRLSIERCGRMTDAGLSYFEGSPLERLAISDCASIRGPGFRHLQGCRSLAGIDVCGMVYDDAVLPHLSGLDQVQRILFLDTRVTEDAAYALEELLPRADVQFDWPAE